MARCDLYWLIDKIFEYHRAVAIFEFFLAIFCTAVVYDFFSNVIYVDIPASCLWYTSWAEGFVGSAVIGSFLIAVCLALQFIIIWGFHLRPQVVSADRPDEPSHGHKSVRRLQWLFSHPKHLFALGFLWSIVSFCAAYAYSVYVENASNCKMPNKFHAFGVELVVVNNLIQTLALTIQFGLLFGFKLRFDVGVTSLQNQTNDSTTMPEIDLRTQSIIEDGKSAKTKGMDDVDMD